MNSSTRFFLILLSLLFYTSWCQAGLTSGARVLTYSASARALGAGEAFTALAEGVDAIYFNPAGLQHMTGVETEVTYYKTLFDTYYTAMALGIPVSQASALGVGLAYFDGGQLDVNFTDGSQKSLKAIQDYVLTLSGSLCLYGGNCVGVNVKFLNSRLAESYSATTFALDGGILYTVWQDLQFGLVVKNLGPQLQYWQEGDSLPAIVQTGLGYRWLWNNRHALNYSLELVKPLDLDFKVHTGVEYGFNRMLFARLGYKFGYDLAGITAGCGFRLGGLQLDYALGAMGDWGLNHLVTLSMRF